jgi:hypothetical protein
MHILRIQNHRKTYQDRLCLQHTDVRQKLQFPENLFEILVPTSEATRNLINLF